MLPPTPDCDYYSSVGVKFRPEGHVTDRPNEGSDVCTRQRQHLSAAHTIDTLLGQIAITITENENTHDHHEYCYAAATRTTTGSSQFYEYVSKVGENVMS